MKPNRILIIGGGATGAKAAARAVNARLRAVVASVEFTGMTDAPKPRGN